MGRADTSDSSVGLKPLWTRATADFMLSWMEAEHPGEQSQCLLDTKLFSLPPWKREAGLHRPSPSSGQGDGTRAPGLRWGEAHPSSLSS